MKLFKKSTTKPLIPPSESTVWPMGSVSPGSLTR